MPSSIRYLLSESDVSSSLFYFFAVDGEILNLDNPLGKLIFCQTLNEKKISFKF